MKECLVCNRIFDNETFDFCLEDGSPLLIISDKEETVISKQSFDLSSSAIIDHQVIAINIAQQFPHVKNVEDLYNCTRGLWRLSKQRAEKAKYAFAVFKREIKEVYEISEWILSDNESSDFWVQKLKSQGTEVKPEVHEGRYQFVGKVAPDSIRNKYVGREMPIAHAQNPIRYFNC